MSSVGTEGGFVRLESEVLTTMQAVYHCSHFSPDGRVLH